MTATLKKSAIAKHYNTFEALLLCNNVIGAIEIYYQYTI
jgi:hypothetical protein